MPAKPPPLVAMIPHKALAARHSVFSVPRVDQITHLGGISLPDCQTTLYERAGKTAGAEYIDLAFRGLTFVPLDCAYWILEREEDRPLKILSASKGLFPLTTSRGASSK